MRLSLATGNVERKGVEALAKARILFVRPVARAVRRGGHDCSSFFESAGQLAHHLIATRELCFEETDGPSALSQCLFEPDVLFRLCVDALKLLLERGSATLGLDAARYRVDVNFT